MAGWQVVAAVESDAQACDTHAANFPEVKLHDGDIAGFLKGRGGRQALGAILSMSFMAARLARDSAKSVPAISRIRATHSMKWTPILGPGAKLENGRSV